MKTKTPKTQALKITLALFFALAIALFFYFDGTQYLSLEALKAKRLALADWVSGHFAVAILAYVGIYIAVTALSLPGALVLTLAGGALFGLIWGTIAVSFASSIGATLAFVAARFLLGDSIRKRFADRLKVIEEGIRQDGAFYLLSLRLVPLIPFFIVNLVMGLTPIRVSVFYIVSQIGMLPGTLAFVFAGTQLNEITSLKGIVSPKLLLAFAIIGLLPLVLKLLLNARNKGKSSK